jgi:hypothetical protein
MDALTDLTALHDAQVAIIKAAMPMLQTVEEYKPLQRDSVITPALLLEAGEFKPGRRTGDGRTPLKIEFAAHCYLSVRTPNAELEIRNFAAKVCQLLDGQRWGMGDALERPEQIAAFPGAFKPDDKGFECWVVTWEQTAHLGELWQEADFLPQEAFFNEAPDIGLVHQDDYQVL